MCAQCRHSFDRCRTRCERNGRHSLRSSEDNEGSFANDSSARRGYYNAGQRVGQFRATACSRRFGQVFCGLQQSPHTMTPWAHVYKQKTSERQCHQLRVYDTSRLCVGRAQNVNE
uniref:Uncharacterized protein n=1 Tax=Plectus sambesii TaxID=2011161 RepID=A0A914X6Q0_9BILA